MSESALGKASSDSNHSDKGFTCECCGDTLASNTTLKRHKRSQHPSELDHSCPTCDKLFESRLAMKSHHKQVHGESLRKQIECAVCGDTFKAPPAKERKYCSRECSHKGQRKRVELTCEVCETVFEVPESIVEERSCCSRECKGELHGKLFSGANNPNYKEEIHITRECAYCGGDFQTTTNEINRDGRDGGKYCSVECMDKWRSENWVGENNPLYEGNDHYYGSNWSRQRRKAWKRDQYRCRVCGATERELGRRPSVHHIKPMWWFKENFDDPEWYEKGNALSNLITLCEAHHSHAEGWFLRPDTRG